MKTTTPLEPKRTIPLRRNWGLEPEEHYEDRLRYQNRRYGLLNHDLFRRLAAVDRFNRTPLERRND